MRALEAFFALAPDERYIESVNAVTSFHSAVVSATVPPNVPVNLQGVGAAAAIVNGARTGSMQWFNAVYPECLNLPRSIVSGAGSITANLEMLDALATQLASDPSNTQLASALIESVESLSARLLDLEGLCAALTVSVSGSGDALRHTSQLLGQASGDLSRSLQVQDMGLRQDIGRLDALRNRPCPNQSEIRAAQEKVQADWQAIGATEQFAVLVDSLSGSAGNAEAGISYLAGTWTQISAIAQDAVTQLDRVVTDPPTVMALDLSSAGESWRSLVAKLDSIIELAADAPGPSRGPIT